MLFPYCIQSVNTKFFAISTKEDQATEQAMTRPGNGPGNSNPPDDSVRAPIFHSGIF